MKRSDVFSRILKAVSRYFVFFMLVAFVITCCTTLFVSALSETLNISLTRENLGVAAKLTFFNVALISLLFTVVDSIRRKWTVERPAKMISEATEKMIKGDFDVRIPPVSKLVADENFNEIINCINKIAEELSGVETLRSDFIANVSHEMKTPLAVMQNYATLLKEENLSEEKRIEYAKAISEASRRLADMVTNVLKLNRLENQQIYPQAKKYNLSEQVCQSLLQYEGEWERKEINIQTDIEDGVYIYADEELLSHVWNNLFSNAFKFTEKGGTVSASLRSEGGSAIVTVSDMGCGMSADVGAHIFEEFYQGDTSHRSSGNGLGLALVRRVVDIIGAEISVESKVGVGTSLTVSLKSTDTNEPC